MASGSESGRRKLFPRDERALRRKQLLDLYRNEHRYKCIVEQDLRPKWRSVPASMHAALGRYSGWHGYHGTTIPDSLLSGSVRIAQAELQEYVDAVRAMTASLNLTFNGDPLWWGAMALHVDVVGGMQPWFTYSHVDRSQPIVNQPSVMLSVHLDHAFARFGMDSTMSPEEQGWAMRIGVPMSDESFQAAEDYAIDLIRGWFAEAKDHVINTSMVRRNAAFLSDSNVRYLFAMLMNRPLERVSDDDPPVRRTLETLANFLELDLPGSRRKQKKTRPRLQEK